MRRGGPGVGKTRRRGPSSPPATRPGIACQMGRCRCSPHSSTYPRRTKVARSGLGHARRSSGSTSSIAASLTPGSARLHASSSSGLGQLHGPVDPRAGTRAKPARGSIEGVRDLVAASRGLGASLGHACRPGPRPQSSTSGTAEWCTVVRRQDSGGAPRGRGEQVGWAAPATTAAIGRRNGGSPVGRRPGRRPRWRWPRPTCRAARARRAPRPQTLLARRAARPDRPCRRLRASSCSPTVAPRWPETTPMSIRPRQTGPGY